MNNYLGYYTVGTTVFQNKTEAIVHANQTLAEVEWHFNDDVFNKVLWTQEPTLSLEQFYKMRAQQIREKYDYIVVMASGGADSTNVIYSFLNNGIAIDEIVASAPISGLRDWNNNDVDNSTENAISETKYAQMPLMNDIASHFPNVKLTLNDYFEDMLHYESGEWLYKSSDWIHPTTVARYSLEKFKHLKDMAEAGKKIGIVYGIDKPSLAVDDAGDLFLVIADAACNVQRPAFKKEYTNVENVLFYYSPDLPQLLAKQAHVVAKWIHLPENANAKQYLGHLGPVTSFEKNRVRQSNWEKSIIPCIYPGTVRKVFQGHKSIRMFFAAHDQWFYKHHSGTMAYQMIDSDFRSFIKVIDNKYLNLKRTAFNVFRKTYRIGKVSDFQILKSPA